MRLTRHLPLIAALLALPLSSPAQDKPKPAEAKEAEAKKDEPESKTVTTEGKVTIGGKTIPYTAETATLLLETDEGKPRASVFHVSYLRSDVKEPSTRPVVFAFNGGPGSSAVWLHLGALGPKRIDIPENGTAAPKPPVTVVDNPDSIIDAADLVLIDPVSTGYSRAEGGTKPGEFHGLRGDIESVGDFIRRWITEHDRWDSPKFILGESYGGVRAAGLAKHMQRRFGMSLNGVVLLSALLDFRTVDTSPGDDLSYVIYLPQFTGVALHHASIKGDQAQLLADAREFAFGPYATALLKGSQLDDESRQAVAARYAELTGLPVDLILASNLRISPTRFRTEILRDQAIQVGRFDGRVKRSTNTPASTSPSGDPSFDYIFGAFSTAMLDYLRSSLDWTAEKPYEIFGNVGGWKWDVSNDHVNLSPDLASAITTNPHLKILVMCGHTDLATPPAGMEYSIRHLGLPADLRANIGFAYYDAGHMFYLNPPDRAKMRADLIKFLDDAR